MGTAQDAGARAEDDALRMLIGRGMTQVGRNYRCRGGEIDLIMRDGAHLVFVEVRFRRRRDFGGALSSIDRRKRERLVTAAQHYLATHAWRGPCRFDVVAFDGRDECHWIRDAFGT
ncbi:MAG: YraN family protein [Chromatiaceae bacterium]|nr:YraN family protein [Gammaproteobacteria bacterium]MCP5298334.1 YraN family protein [Chromatiaceae bacterium]MCP5423126.1 YraN family protein [Chromatiaceae bacterium]